jgi:hypothetical protein
VGPGDHDAVTVRAVTIAVGGAATAATAYGVSRAVDGIVGAAAFELALFAIPLTVGIVIAQQATAGPRTPRSIVRRSAAAQVFPDLESVAAGRCRTCGDTRSLHGAVWVCPVCDHV